MDAIYKSIQLNNNNIINQANTKAEHKRASERIQAELRPSGDASKWYANQANRERTEESQRAAEQAGQRVRDMLKSDSPQGQR